MRGERVAGRDERSAGLGQAYLLSGEQFRERFEERAKPGIDDLGRRTTGGVHRHGAFASARRSASTIRARSFGLIGIPCSAFTIAA